MGRAPLEQGPRGPARPPPPGEAGRGRGLCGGLPRRRLCGAPAARAQSRSVRAVVTAAELRGVSDVVTVITVDPVTKGATPSHPESKAWKHGPERKATSR